MPSLRELQRDFARALGGDPSGALAAEIVARGLTGEDRIGIYRNNVRENFTEALMAAFPVLLRLGGETWFRQMAAAYRRRHPSRTGNLFFTGERLADFLEERLGGTEHQYFADVARLEWLCQEAAIAPEVEGLSIDKLAQVAGTDYERLRLELNPRVRLLQSRYPILRIWQQNQPEQDSGETIDLAGDGDRLLIRIGDSKTRLERLGAADFAFLDALANGRRLAVAYAVAAALETHFALPEKLRGWVSTRVITDFSIH